MRIPATVRSWYQDHEEQHGHRQVDDQAGQEGGDLVEGQPGLLHDPVGDAAWETRR